MKNYQNSKLCIYDGCDQLCCSKSMCKKHYLRIRRSNPETKWVNKKKCSYPGCEREHNSKGYCLGHRTLQLEGKELRDIEARGKGGRKPLGKLCTIEYCGKRHEARGYCKTHYHTMIYLPKKGIFTTPRIKNESPCIVNECKKQAQVKSMCRPHYQKSNYVARTRIVKTCTVNECESKHHGKGYCQSHYKQFIVIKCRRTKEPRIKTICEVADCDNYAVAKNYCNKHYTRWRRHGDTEVNYSITRNDVKRRDINSTIRNTYDETVSLDDFFGGIDKFRSSDN